MMKHTEDLTEFIQKYDKDVRLIMLKAAKGRKHKDLDDLTQQLYLAMHKNKVLSRYDSSRGASFSTWMFKNIANFFNSYNVFSNRDKMLRDSLSLDNSSDGSPANFHEIIPDNTHHNQGLVDLTLSLEKYREKLEKSTRVTKYKDSELLDGLIIGYSKKELGAIFDVTLQAVSSRAKHLREGYEKFTSCPLC